MAEELIRASEAARTIDARRLRMVSAVSGKVEEYGEEEHEEEMEGYSAKDDVTGEDLDPKESDEGKTGGGGVDAKERSI